MDTTTLENRYIVRSVRGTLRDKMQKIKPGAPTYCLRELSSRFYYFSPSGYTIRLEHAPTREKVGWLVGEAGHSDDPLVNYGLVQLANGESFEFEQHHHPDLKVSAFPPQATLGVTTIRHNGAAIGECRVAGLGRSLGLSYENAWELVFAGKPFGRVSLPSWNAWDELHLARPDSSALPLNVPRSNALSDPFSLLWALVEPFIQLLTLAWRLLARGRRYMKRKRDDDLIISPEARHQLNEDEMAFYFAVSLLFRVLAGLSECHSQ